MKETANFHENPKSVNYIKQSNTPFTPKITFVIDSRLLSTPKNPSCNPQNQSQGTNVRGSLSGGKKRRFWRYEREAEKGEAKAMNTKGALLMPSGRVTAILGGPLITGHFSAAGLLRESFPEERKLARIEARKRRRRRRGRRRRRRRPNGGYPRNGARPPL
ncbi:hypothetical protein K0M31_011527 [Melipona bicolor]|uniref:Uncharacterized protein n=1 Tax=Melipona bicolor TaxID=60889 RepID=A0AA40KUV8_9HYME|nr:hypothetical protein K0M31_011527 [Melipona bicolor]